MTGGDFEVNIRNANDVPMYGCLLVRRNLDKLVLNTLPPGETLSFAYNFGVDNPGMAVYEYPHLYLHFMDTHEQAWRRGAWGSLERLPCVDPLPEQLPD